MRKAENAGWAAEKRDSRQCEQKETACVFWNIHVASLLYATQYVARGLDKQEKHKPNANHNWKSSCHKDGHILSKYHSKVRPCTCQGPVFDAPWLPPLPRSAEAPGWLLPSALIIPPPAKMHKPTENTNKPHKGALQGPHLCKVSKRMVFSWVPKSRLLQTQDLYVRMGCEVNLWPRALLCFLQRISWLQLEALSAAPELQSALILLCGASWYAKTSFFLTFVVNLVFMAA